MMCENHMTFKFHGPQIMFHWNTSDLFTCWLWLLCDTTAEVTCSDRDCMARPVKLTILTIYPFRKRGIPSLKRIGRMQKGKTVTDKMTYTGRNHCYEREGKESEMEIRVINSYHVLNTYYMVKNFRYVISNLH